MPAGDRASGDRTRSSDEKCQPQRSSKPPPTLADPEFIFLTPTQKGRKEEKGRTGTRKTVWLMAATTNTSQPPPAAQVDSVSVSASADELTAKAVNKRYEGLVMVRTKAIKGKGAWYWAHLEPMLVHNADTGLAKAVKLRCSLCEAVFSASNPSRTASEHLKRGTCPNFASVPKPISSISPSGTPVVTPPQPSSSAAAPGGGHRKRSSSAARSVHSYEVSPLAIVDPTRFCADYSPTATVVPHHHQHQQQHHHPHHQQQHLVLSGGKEDFGALAMLEDSVKKLKSPKTSPSQTLSKTQIDAALDLLVDWAYESCGSVSFSSFEHPKFRAFLSQVGLPAVSRRDFMGSRVDVKYDEAKVESEVRIKDAMFFQVASEGWKYRDHGGFNEENLVNLTVNLPNGTSLYRRALFVSGSVPSKYAEEVLWETVTGICGNALHQCVGIVADRFRAKALQNLENQNPWMVNVCCQVQGLSSLIKDFSRELPLFKNVTQNCLKLAKFINNNGQIRTSFHKYQMQEYGHSGLLRVPSHGYENLTFGIGPAYIMLEDILNSSRALQVVSMDESYKMISMEDPVAGEVAEMIQEMGFWNEVEAMHSLIKLVKSMAREIEIERPLIGQCLPLWNDLRSKVKGWCSKYHIAEGLIEKIIDRRFDKNYHPAWAAAYILDPLYLIRDTSGKYLPPFKYLTPEQEKDVDKLITRLVSREEAHIALMDLMKWRTMGLDPVYAKAVQMKERDPLTGKMRIANPQSSRLVWETHLTEFKSLGKVAARLIFLHATSCGFKCNSSFLRWVSSHGHSREGIERAQKLIFIAAHSKLERRDFSSDEDKDAELFALANGEDDVLNEVLVDASSV